MSSSSSYSSKASEEYEQATGEEAVPEGLGPPKNPFAYVFRTLEDASFSILSRIISFFIIALVLLSTVTFIIGSLPKYWEGTSAGLRGIEYFVIITFTVEYGLRLLTCWTYYKPWKWFFKPLNLVDLVAIVPFYIELGVHTNVAALAAVRVLRLFRIVRLFKLGKYTAITFVIIDVFKVAGSGLISFSVLILFAIIVMASLMFFAETSGATFNNDSLVWTYNDNDANSFFQSIPDAMWWAIVTMTTVGYGDTYPRTPWGKLVGSLTISMGILTIAFPVTIIGTALSDIWKDYTEKRNKDTKLDFAAAEQKLEREILDLLGQVAQKQAKLEALRQKHKLADQHSLGQAQTENEETPGKKRSKSSV